MLSTPGAVQDHRGPPRDSLDLKRVNRFRTLPSEIQMLIFELCIPKRDASRVFFVSLDYSVNILLEDK